MKSIWWKVGHEQLYHVNKNILARALKKIHFHYLLFFSLSVHETNKEFLAFIKATIHAFVISITCTFSVD